MSKTVSKTGSTPLTVRDLVTIDDGVMGPNGDKADLIKDEAADNLDMTVVEFCREALHTHWIDTVSERYVRRVLTECRPESVATFDTGEITFE